MSFDFNDFSYDAEAAKASRAKKVANNTVGQWIISSAEVTLSKSSNKPMLVTYWNLFETVGDGNKIINTKVRKNFMLPVSGDDKETRGRNTAQLQELVQKLGLVEGARPDKGSKDNAAWDTYNASTGKAVEGIVKGPDSLVGKSTLGKFWYKTDKATGELVIDQNGYRNSNLSLYGNTLPDNVAVTAPENIWER